MCISFGFLGHMWETFSFATSQPSSQFYHSFLFFMMFSCVCFIINNSIIIIYLILGYNLWCVTVIPQRGISCVTSQFCMHVQDLQFATVNTFTWIFLYLFHHSSSFSLITSTFLIMLVISHYLFALSPLFKDLCMAGWCRYLE